MEMRVCACVRPFLTLIVYSRQNNQYTVPNLTADDAGDLNLEEGQR